MFDARSQRTLYNGLEEVDCGLVLDDKPWNLAATLQEGLKCELQTGRDGIYDA